MVTFTLTTSVVGTHNYDWALLLRSVAAQAFCERKVQGVVKTFFLGHGRLQKIFQRCDVPQLPLTSTCPDFHLSYSTFRIGESTHNPRLPAPTHTVTVAKFSYMDGWMYITVCETQTGPKRRSKLKRNSMSFLWSLKRSDRYILFNHDESDLMCYTYMYLITCTLQRCSWATRSNCPPSDVATVVVQSPVSTVVSAPSWSCHNRLSGWPIDSTLTMCRPDQQQHQRIVTWQMNKK